MKLKTKVLIFRLIGVAVFVRGIALAVRWFRYGRGSVIMAVLLLYLAVSYIVLIPRGFARRAREEARLKAKREEEARRDRERLERVKKEEREWLERQKGAKPE